MKKIIVIVMAAVMVLSMASCGGATTVTTNDEKAVTVKSIEELETYIEKDVTDTAAALRTEYDELVAEIDTFDKYVAEKSAVEGFYNKIGEETRQLCIRMRGYSIAYVEFVMASGGSSEEMYDAIRDMYDCIYDDASGEVYDLIYDDLMGDMYDAFYAGVVSDGYDAAAYDVWSDMMSEEYDMWSDTLSDVYDEWSDAASDIYDFWSDVYDAMWDEDKAEMDEAIKAFKEDIKDLKAEEK